MDNRTRFAFPMIYCSHPVLTEMTAFPWLNAETEKIETKTTYWSDLKDSLKSERVSKRKK